MNSKPSLLPFAASAGVIGRLEIFSKSSPLNEWLNSLLELYVLVVLSLGDGLMSRPSRNSEI